MLDVSRNCYKEQLRSLKEITAKKNKWYFKGTSKLKFLLFFLCSVCGAKQCDVGRVNMGWGGVVVGWDF